MVSRGCRISLRGKVNDSLISGLAIVDSVLPIGRGQRQLILGDRYTGKTCLFLCILLLSNRYNNIGTIEGYGTKRLFTFYVGINQNLSKLSAMIDLVLVVD